MRLPCLTHALNLLGIPSIHLPRDLEQIRDFDGATDIPVAMAYQHLDALYPNSKFILTIQDTQSWLLSCQRHTEQINTYYQQQLPHWIKELRLRCFGTCNFDRDIWLTTYQHHVQGVKQYFKDREQDLLILNICDGHGWNELCEFLGSDIPAADFPHSNKSSSFDYNKYIQKKLISNFSSIILMKV